MYIQAIFIDEENKSNFTNVGAKFDSWQKTKKQFELIGQQYGVDLKDADFIFDLVREYDDEIIGTFGIKKENWTNVTGEQLMPESYYQSIEHSLSAA